MAEDTASIPPAGTELYNRNKYGYYGEFGAGANAKVLFLQTAITKAELDHITLIENIEGSEKWNIQNLFQRDVDRARVENDLLPYLRDHNSVKFFNPLTLAVLPLDEKRSYVVKELVHVSPTEVSNGEHKYRLHEWKGYFEFREHTLVPAFSEVRWNSDTVKIVAIDGQHRLSALKRWKAMPGGAAELGTWTIPAVVIGIFKSEQHTAAPDLLEVVRRTFVYINSRAEEVNEARKILLNDESVNCVCTQVLIQDAHSNDVQEITGRDEEKVPLLYYDWRGVAKRHAKDAAPAAIVTSEELKGWFDHYLLGEDGSKKQRESLELDDMIPPLVGVREASLTHDDADRVRQQFADRMLPGLNYFLEEFEPSKKYISELRQLERDLAEASDVDRHAFMKIRFGASREPPDLMRDVELRTSKIRERLEQLKKDAFPELLLRDLGMRAAVSAFADSKAFYDEFESRTTSWREFAEWCMPALNEVYSEGWFKSYSNQEPQRRKLLTHIAFDDAGTIINYKFHQVSSGFGAFLLLLVFRNRASEERLLDVWDEVSERLNTTLRRGFRSSHRRELAVTFTGTHQEFKKQTNRLAQESTNNRLREIAAYANVPVSDEY